MAETTARLLTRIRDVTPGQGLAVALAGESDRLVLWLPVFLGLGIALYFGLAVEPAAWTWMPLLGLIGALVLGAWFRPAWRQVLLPTALVPAGLLAALLRSQAVEAPVLAEELGPIQVSGLVLELEVEETRPRMVLQPGSIPGLAPEATPERVRLRLLRPPVGVVPGSRVEVRAVLRPPPEPAAPGAYDFARQAYFQRLGAVGYALAPPRILEPPAAEAGTQRWSAAWNLAWSSLRQALAQRIAAALDGDAGAVAVALITGDRSAIPEPVLEAMRQSGLAHLLAISGLHLGLVAGLVFFLSRAVLALIPALALRYPIKKWAALLAAAAAFFYLFLVGATIPAQRASVMVWLALLAVILDRQPLSLRLLAAAAALVLILAPESLLSASFQMSFAAVTALVAGYELLGPRVHPGWRDRSWAGRLGLYLGLLMPSSVIANLATAPFAAYHFNRLAVFGLVANLIAVPLTAFWIMPAALFAMLLLPFGLEAWPLAVMGAGLDLLLAVAAEISSWPGAVIPVRAMPLWGLCAAVLGGLWLCLWQRPWRLLGLLGPALGILAVALAAPPDLLVSGDGKLIAVRTEKGALAFSSLRRGSYQRDIWLRRSGSAQALAWPLEDGAAWPELSCDSLGCLYRRDGMEVAIALDGRALDEDCRRARVLISLEPLRRMTCPSADLVIDRFDLWREGAHALWLGGGEGALRSRSVAQDRGVRPWVRLRPSASGAD